MRNMILCVLVSAVLLIGACSFKSINHGSEITDDQIAKVIDGQTTKQDIYMLFGDPSRTMEKETVFFYSWTRGSKSSILGIIGGGSAYTQSLVIVFDNNDIVKSHKVTRGDTKQATGIAD